MSNPIQRVSEVIEAATSALECEAVVLPAVQAARLAWLQQVLQAKIAELRAMLADLEGGFAVTELGYQSNEEFEDAVADLDVQIMSLKTQIRTLQEVGR
jgi:hypothetical protein